jgi:hypothetical protein
MSSHSNPDRVLPRGAKWAFTTRHVDRTRYDSLDPDVGRAISGDLLLARVDAIGTHRRLQLAEGRHSDLYQDDLVVVACGDRYASDQFEGIAALDPAGCDLLAGGGVAGTARRQHDRLSRPTRLVPIGLLVDPQGRVLNLEQFAIVAEPAGQRPLVIGVVGTAMNSGKTTTVTSLVKGLARAGLEVAAIKATGTGAFGDVHAYADAGATVVADFTDAGLVSTYRQPIPRIEAALGRLLAHVAARNVDVAVVELADGILQAETSALLRSPTTRRLFDGFVFAGGDALGVAAGIDWLAGVGITPVATSGLVSRSPLAMAEAEAATNVPVVTRESLLDPADATAILAQVRPRATLGRVAA